MDDFRMTSAILKNLDEGDNVKKAEQTLSKDKFKNMDNFIEY